MDRQKAKQIIYELSKLYPDASPALNYASPFELLVAVILSAQCTDKRVNVVTEALFKTANTPEVFANMDVEDLEKAIYSCGFYKNKAKHIIEASRAICDKFGGEVPNNLEQLNSLAGVGRKTANVVFSVAFGGDAIAVDTHVFRVANRLGLASAKNVLKTEQNLMDIIDKSEWSKAHHFLIYHGRNICSSQSPKCEKCALNSICDYYNTKNNT